MARKTQRETFVAGYTAAFNNFYDSGKLTLKFKVTKATLDEMIHLAAETAFLEWKAEERADV